MPRLSDFRASAEHNIIAITHQNSLLPAGMTNSYSYLDESTYFRSIHRKYSHTYASYTLIGIFVSDVVINI